MINRATVVSIYAIIIIIFLVGMLETVKLNRMWGRGSGGGMRKKIHLHEIMHDNVFNLQILIHLCLVCISSLRVYDMTHETFCEL